MADPKSAVTCRFYDTAAVSPGEVAANSSTDVDVTVTGLKANYPVIAWPQTALAATWDDVVYMVLGCITADHLLIRVHNPTSGAITPASEDFSVVQL